ncbi:MAG: tetratricopeptide repeat protein [Candidatus Schekmanbacteria bacterium]|nr:tetratricopeptide repeat protein [Candidatus Schekmanbacteria bacterium]
MLGRRGKVLEAVIPALRSVPGQAELPDAAPLPGAAAEQRLFAAAWEALVAYGEDEPLILVIDDLQWADDLTLRAARSFAERIERREGAVLVACTYRADEAGDELRALAAAPNVSCLRLGGLAPEAVGSIVADMLAAHRPDEGIVSFARRHGEGNPFFLAEYLRGAVEAGLLARSAEGRWRLAPEVTAATAADALARLALPTTIRAVVEQRLARLPAAVRTMVQAAAAVGREVGGELLAELCGTSLEEAVEQQQELLRRQVLEVAGNGQTLRFLHDKLREVAYDLVEAGERPGLHRRIAAAPAARKAASESVAEGELGRHWELAEELEAAATCYLAVAREAGKRYATALAEERYRKYLALADAQSEESIEVRLELVSRILIPHTRPREALEVIGPALAAPPGCGQPRYEARVRVAEAAGMFMLRRLDEAEVAARAALCHLQSAPDEETEAMALRILGVSSWARGDLAAAERYLESSRDIFRRLGHLRGQMVTASNLALVFRMTDVDRAIELEREARRLGRASGDKPGEALSFANEAGMLLSVDRHQEALACLQSAMDTQREIGHEVGVARCQASMALLAESEGNLEQARHLYDQAIAVYERAREVALLAPTLGNAGFLLAAVGEVEQARRTLHESEQRCDESKDSQFQIQSLCYLATLERRVGTRRQTVEGYTRKAIDLARRLGQTQWLLLAYCAEGHLRLMDGMSARESVMEVQHLINSLGQSSTFGGTFRAAVSNLLQAQEAYEAGQRLFRGELLRTIPEGLQAWLRHHGHLPGDCSPGRSPG